ncbi:MAG: hypothetical protein Q8L74_05530 [Nitrospirota bacterium]|nr:hypothetical protein [Nitrospirota bacterium]MDP2382185.1 hypothetical protein [Nitrospirota bacterium]MDP3595513.1 hypothetical protein [Nitrospirota bacterium]
MGSSIGPCLSPDGPLTLFATGFCIQVFLRIDSRSHSVSDMLYGVFSYWLLTLLA